MGKKEKDQRLLRRNLLGVCVFLLALPVLWPMGGRGFCHAGDFAGTSIGGGAHGKEAADTTGETEQVEEEPAKERGFSALMT